MSELQRLSEKEYLQVWQEAGTSSLAVLISNHVLSLVPRLPMGGETEPVYEATMYLDLFPIFIRKMK